MSYLSTTPVNTWLATTKYTVDAIESPLDEMVQGIIFGKLALRYDTSTWTDGTDTPALILSAMSMLYAAYYMQRQISEDDQTPETYPVRLETRALDLIAGILAELVDIPDADPDPTLTTNRGLEFFPTDASTQLAIDDPTDPNGTPRVFSMQHRF